MHAKNQRVTFEYGFAEPAGEGWWTFQERSAGKLVDTPLHDVLQWVLQQLNFGNWISEQDVDGDIVSMTIGRDAAMQHGLPQEEAIEEARRRFLSVSIAGLVAKAQHEGTSPDAKELVERLAEIGRTNRNLRMNLEFHYTFAFLDSLGRMTKRSLQLAGLGIHGKASDATIAILREATMCHLYRLSRASIALCRSALEDALFQQVGAEELQVERTSFPKKGDLTNLISAALRLKIVDEALALVATRVRREGNAAVHRGEGRFQDQRIGGVTYRKDQVGMTRTVIPVQLVDIREDERAHRVPE